MDFVPMLSQERFGMTTKSSKRLVHLIQSVDLVYVTRNSDDTCTPVFEIVDEKWVYEDWADE